MVTAIGEVVQSGSFAFVVECYELEKAPPLGSLVMVRGGGLEVYGVVASAATAPREPGRVPIALGAGEGEDLYRRHPQLPQLLCTRFDAIVAGHRQGENLRYHLPPSPPRLHSPVYPCSPEQQRQFAGSPDFLDLLLAAPIAEGREEVIAACLRHLAGSLPPPADGEFLVAIGKELTRRLAGDARLLLGILRGMRP